MSNVLSLLATVCREHLLRAKILVVPSLAIGRRINGPTRLPRLPRSATIAAQSTP